MHLNPLAIEPARWSSAFMQPRQWRNIEQFRKEMANGQVVVLRNTQHAFYRDPALKARIVREVRQFLLGQKASPDIDSR